MLSGKVKRNNYDGKLTFDKPTYSIMTGEFLENQNSNLNIARIVPIYTVCEDLSIKVLRRAIFNAIQVYKSEITNVIPDFIREKLGILDKKIAVEQIHFPESQELLEQARFSLIFEELFLIQLKLVRLREQNSANHSALALKIKEKGLVHQFIDGLPFELTGAQKRAVNEILTDLNSDIPMARLLQGDVGSGKTVVATIMLLAGVENGYQGALMAPTEILAQQHYNNLQQWLVPMGISVGLFLGSQGKKVREKFRTDLRNGQMNIAVGTHALIQDDVDFYNLGAIVVDEQHRFGVKQRNVLKKKSQNPQMLTMTATPIPRTLALTVHGDLDLTIIDELPKFTPHSIADKRMMVLWLRFLTEINSNTKDIPADLLNDPEIGKAVEDLEVSGFTDAELRAYDKFWDSVSVERTLLDDRYQKGMEEGMEKGRAEGIAEGIEEGMSQRSLEIARKMLAKGLDEASVMDMTGLTAEEIKLLKAEM